jgi:hypothetical protein
MGSIIASIRKNDENIEHMYYRFRQMTDGKYSYELTFAVTLKLKTNQQA